MKRFEEIGYYPTMSELFEDPRITDLEDPYFGGQRLGEVYGSLVDDVPIWYQSVYRGAFADAVNAEMPLFYDGSITADEFLDTVIAAVEDEIEFSQ